MRGAGIVVVVAGLLVGCRDYRGLEGVGDLSAAATDLGVDQSVELDLGETDLAGADLLDLAPSCAPVPHDRDAGPPPDPNIAWATEALYPLQSPDGGGPIGKPSRLTVGDGDGDGLGDVVTVAPNGTINGSQLGYLRGKSTSGHADLQPAWTANSQTPVGQVLLADFLPDESAAPKRRAELITSFDGLAGGGSIQQASVSVLRLTATGVFPIMPALELANLAGTAAKTTSRTVSMAAGDLDADGKIDVVLGINHYAAGAPPYPMGAVVVLWGGTVTPTGDGITPPYFDWTNVASSYLEVPATHPALLSVADVDGDCVPEIVAAGIATDASNWAVQIVRASKTRALSAATTGVLTDGQPLWMTVLDLDRAGKRSVLLTRSTDYVILDPQGGSLGSPAFDRRTRAINAPGSTCASGDVGCLVGPRGLVSADFDRDGADDMFLFGYFSFQVPTAMKGAFYRNDSLGNLVRTPLTGTVDHDPTASSRQPIADARVGDLDGDGRPDIVFLDEGFRYGLFLDRVGP